MSYDDSEIDSAAQIINQHPGVTQKLQKKSFL